MKNRRLIMYASNEPKSVLARDLGDCRVNERQRVWERATSQSLWLEPKESTGERKNRKESIMAKKDSYDASSISVLEGLEAVRKRPGMYIGSVSRKGLNHLIYEIVDNSVDEHLAGYCDLIRVTLEADGSCTVSDNGRGIPVGMHEKGISAERLVFTTLHAGGKFDNGAYKTSGGLHGVGSSVVNALSTYLDVKVSREGYVHHDRYERGIPVIELEEGLLPKIGRTKETGTCINFLPDPEIFEKTRFTEEEVKKLCERYPLDFEQAKRWYDGYVFEQAGHIYSPNSIIEAIQNQNFANYWTQTETYESLMTYMDLNFDGLKDSVIDMIGGMRCKIDVGSFQNDMTSLKSKDDVLTLFVHLGYLAYDRKTKEVFIPNEEIREEFIRSVKNGNRRELVKAVELSDKLLNATIRKDEATVAELIEEAHAANTSPKFYNNEQALRSVVIMAYLSSVDDYCRFEELASGKGYIDLLFLPTKQSAKPALVIELKWNKSGEKAIRQGEEQQYWKFAETFRYKGPILLVGINYSTKTKKHTCRIKEVRKELS